jgi:hypothetical protein
MVENSNASRIIFGIAPPPPSTWKKLERVAEIIDNSRRFTFSVMLLKSMEQTSDPSKQFSLTEINSTAFFPNEIA